MTWVVGEMWLEGIFVAVQVKEPHNSSLTLMLNDVEC